MLRTCPVLVGPDCPLVPGERTKEQAEKEERERREHDEKTAVDKRLTDQTQRLADETESLGAYTRRLAGFTLLLFFAAVGQTPILPLSPMMRVSQKTWSE